MALQPINANNGAPKISSADKDMKASEHITGIEKAGRDVSLKGKANFTTTDSSVKELAMSPSENENSPRDIHGWKWAMVVIATLSTTFLWALDNTIVADIQPAIIRSFNSVEKLPWLGVAFAVGAASTNLLWSKLYQTFNNKFLYLLSLFFFEAGSAICGAANTINALIVGRAICGLGGIGVYVGVLMLLSVFTTIQERPNYMGMIGLVWGLGTVLGPVIGGAFADSSATWRWAFYINLCIGGVFTPVYLFLIPSFDPRPGVSFFSRLREIDLVGTIIIIGTFIAGCMAINFGGIIYAWGSWRIILLFALSGVFCVIFMLQQAFVIFTTKEKRLFPVELMKSKEMIILAVQTSCSGTALLVPIYIIPLIFQFAKSDGSLQAGVRLLPFVVSLVVFAIANGALLSKYGYYLPWYVIGGMLVTTGSALMFTVTESSSTSQIYGYSCLIGAGAGAYVQASFSVGQGKVSSEKATSVTSFMTFAQITAMTIAISSADSIFLNMSVLSLHELLPDVPIEQLKGIVAGVADSTVFDSLPDTVNRQALAIVIGSLSKTFALPLAAGALTLVLSVFMKHEKLFVQHGGGA
ncbi:hypothetical protein V499_00190 [Pseudogymnoascus sp. VKM F-103]|nr:hypothetical protein V499_00190 [Pseudogymnoascus sp. VKM F-103]